MRSFVLMHCLITRYNLRQRKFIIFRTFLHLRNFVSHSWRLTGNSVMLALLAVWNNEKFPESLSHLGEYFVTLAFLEIDNNIGQIEVVINFVHAVINNELKSFLLFGPDSEHFKESVLRCKVHLQALQHGHVGN